MKHLQRDLDASFAEVQWTGTAYLIAVASLLVFAGRLGDRYGHQQVFAWGMVGFGAASAGIGFAPGVVWVIALRVVQGVFGALLQPATLGMLRAAFPPDRLGMPVALRTSAIGLAVVTGPLVGGALAVLLPAWWISSMRHAGRHDDGRARRVALLGLFALAVQGLADFSLEFLGVAAPACALAGALSASRPRTLSAARLRGLAVGLAGLWSARNAGGARRSWMAFFLGVTLVFFGSGYYHLEPHDQSLVWDRLPMTLAFMALFALVIGDRVGARAGRLLLVDESLRDIRVSLLEADVSHSVIQDFLKNVSEQALGQKVLLSLNPDQQLIGMIHEELLAKLGPVDVSLHLKPGVTVIMLCGLQGSGKTTTCGKLAQLLVELGGFAAPDVRVLQGAGLGGVLGALGELRAKVAAAREQGRRAVVLFYYTGHSDGQGLELGRELLPFGDLRSALAGLAAAPRACSDSSTAAESRRSISLRVSRRSRSSSLSSSRSMCQSSTS